MMIIRSFNNGKNLRQGYAPASPSLPTACVLWPAKSRGLALLCLGRTVRIAVALLALPLHAAQTYNLLSQYDNASNPSSSGWSYGYRTSSSGAFTVFPWRGVNYYDSGYVGWTLSSSVRYPEVNRDATTVQAVPGTSSQSFSGARWTATTNGTATVTATFDGYWKPGDPGVTVAGAYVFTNNVVGFQQDINNNVSLTPVSFSSAVTVKPGDTIDFMVGPNTTINSNTWSRTFLTVSISVVPSTTTALESSANPSTYGDSVTFTATVTPSAAGGTVTFKDGATAIGSATLSGGVATLTTSSLAAGFHSITAVYGGDATYTGSTNTPLSQTVSEAAQTITFAEGDWQSKTDGNAAFDLVASASSGLPVTFESLNASVATVSGTTVTIVGSGTATIRASQAGDANFGAAASVDRVLTVAAAVPGLALTLAGGDRLVLAVGDTLSGGVTVASGATLAGVGTIAGGATVDGTLEVGATAAEAGTLTFEDGLCLDADASLRVHVFADGTCDRCAVDGGRVTVGGALIPVVAEGYVAADRLFTVLTHTAGIAGAFANVAESTVEGYLDAGGPADRSFTVAWLGGCALTLADVAASLEFPGTIFLFQ